MISLAPTPLLTLCLLAATLLGAGIGACLWHLRSATRFRRALENARRSAEAERKALETMLLQARESAASKQAEAREVARRARANADRAQSAHETLVAHAREQSRRIDVLEAEILGYEGRRARPRSDDGAGKRASGRRAAPDASGALGRDDEDEVPVLNRRVGVGPVREAGFPIGGDLDTPTLAGSEFSGKADDPALELLDTRNRFSDGDE